MGTWSIIQAEATENLITNPSFEIDTTGYTTVNASIARVATDQAVGIACGEITPTSNVTAGIYYGISVLSADQTYTFSFSIKGAVGVPYEAFLYSNSAQQGSAVQFTGDGSWRRYSVTATMPGISSGERLYIRKNNNASTAPFYIDALQCEAKSYATTYCDGDQDGCIWTAGAHSSTSIRSAQSATGGKVVDLVDTNNLGLNIKASVGVSMPDFELIDDISAQSDGADHQRTVARPRQFQLVGQLAGSSWSDLLTRRKALMNLVSPRRLATDQPFEVRYNLDGALVGIDARYEGGLNKGRVDGVSIEQISLRLKSQKDPFWRRALGTTGGQNGKLNDASSITAQDTLTNVEYIIQQNADGTWAKLSTGLPAACYDIALGGDGTIYAVGGLGGSNGFVKSWDGSSWSNIGTAPTFTNNVSRLAIDPVTGDIWIVGNWTATSPTLSYTGYYDGSWHAPATGNPNAACSDIKFLPDGRFYIAGSFTSIGATSAAAIALIDGATVTALGSGISGGTAGIACMAIGPDGRLFVGGAFTTAGGNPASNIAVYDPDTNTWSPLAGGVNSTVFDMAFGPDGNLYIIGNFTTANGKQVNYTCFWNGNDFFPLGVGLGAVANRVFVDANNNVYVGGTSEVAGGILMPDRFFKWLGGNWQPGAAINLPSTSSVNAMLFAPDGTTYLGFDGHGTAAFEGGVIAPYEGDAETYPVLTIVGPGNLFKFSNYTTDQFIYFDVELGDGEQVILDLRPGKKTFVSNFRGDLFDKIRGGSDTESFCIAPGDNDISVFIDDASATAVLIWETRFLGFEGVIA